MYHTSIVRKLTSKKLVQMTISASILAGIMGKSHEAHAFDTLHFLGESKNELFNSYTSFAIIEQLCV